jgi:hypothetical protein
VTVSLSDNLCNPFADSVQRISNSSRGGSGPNSSSRVRCPYQPWLFPLAMRTSSSMPGARRGEESQTSLCQRPSAPSSHALEWELQPAGRISSELHRRSRTFLTRFSGVATTPGHTVSPQILTCVSAPYQLNRPSTDGCAECRCSPFYSQRFFGILHRFPIPHTSLPRQASLACCWYSRLWRRSWARL